MSRTWTPPRPEGDPWTERTGHRAWLAAEGRRLLDFSKASRIVDGFAALDAAGAVPGGAAPDLVLTARKTHAYALAALQDLPGTAALVAHGLAALAGPLRDRATGGWRDATGRKQAYAHAFVALAAVSAAALGHPAARPLMEDAASLLATRF